LRQRQVITRVGAAPALGCPQSSIRFQECLVLFRLMQAAPDARPALERALAGRTTRALSAHAHSVPTRGADHDKRTGYHIKYHNARVGAGRASYQRAYPPSATL